MKLYARIYLALKRNGIEAEEEAIRTILEGTGTKADGDITDIIEALNACEYTHEIKNLLRTLYCIRTCQIING